MNIERIAEINQLLDEHPPNSTMVDKVFMMRHLRLLDQRIMDEVPGDVVELGCAFGTSALLTRRLLDLRKSAKRFHVYDSFNGLPEKREEDGDCPYGPGDFICSVASIAMNFSHDRLTPPVIHPGWFSEIPDYEYPPQICFAFLDGDMYTSIRDAILKVAPRMVWNGVIIVHDFDNKDFPGAKRACEDHIDLSRFIDVGNGVYVRKSDGPDQS